MNASLQVVIETNFAIHMIYAILHRVQGDSCNGEDECLDVLQAPEHEWRETP